MQVANATWLVGDPLLVATSVALRILAIDFGGGVERLMKIANVVDDETESEGLLVVLVAEPLLDLFDVGRGARYGITLQEGSEIGECVHDIDIGRLKAEVIERGVWLVQIRLINEVPVALCGVALALDVISEGSALGEGVRAFILRQGRVGGRQVAENGESLIERRRAAVFEDLLSSS